MKFNSPWKHVFQIAHFEQTVQSWKDAVVYIFSQTVMSLTASMFDRKSRLLTTT